ncbi:MAG TPA: hypothetical protein VF013_01620 [Candidatus Limnocylindria bacterium]
MNRASLRNELPDPVRRYFEEVARMNPPHDLMDTTIAEVEASPRVNRFSMPVLALAAAVVVALAALIGFGLYRTQVGPPNDKSPSPTADAGGGGLPTELTHIFLGPGTSAPAPWNGTVAALHVRAGSLEYEPDGNRVMIYGSRAALVGDNRLQLESTNGRGGCRLGNAGTYTYELTPGGNFLTLTAETDDCPARAQALAGVWERSVCKPAEGYCLGALEAGSYSSAIVDPRSTPSQYSSRYGAITYTVPEGWANFLDDGLNYGLTTQAEWDAWAGRDCFDCPGTRSLIEVLVGPGPARTDCTESYEPGVGFTIDDLAAWLTSHPGLDTSEVQDLTINGRPAKSMTITARADWTGTCPEDANTDFVAVPVFYHQDSWHWALKPETSYGVVLVDIGGDAVVAVMIDSADEAQLPAFIEGAMPIIQTFDFPEP